MSYFKNKDLVNSLFTNFKLGNLTLPNRIVMAPMTRCKSPNNQPNELNVDYYQKRAKGGTGLIITEGTCIDHEGAHGYPNVPSFFGETSLAGWKKVVDAVHKENGIIFPQLWHVGSVRRKGMPPNHEAPSYGPSSITHPYLLQQGTNKFGAPMPPVEMTQNDIDHVIKGFADAAKNAQLLGFDGIEVHAAHAYLLDQFFWSHTNKRTDKYGGKTLADRVTFGVEVIRAIREAVGDDFPLIMRISNWKFGQFDAKDAKTPHELAHFLTPFVEAGVDAFHCSAHRFYIAEYPKYSDTLNYAGWVKKLSGKPTITVGSVGIDKAFPDSFLGVKSMPSIMDNLAVSLNNDEFDLVALGRALLADAELPNKLKNHLFNDIIPFNNTDLGL